MCFYNKNLDENGRRGDNKPESKPNKMFHENVLEYNEICYVNVKEVSCLAVFKICNLSKDKQNR